MGKKTTTKTFKKTSARIKAAGVKAAPVLKTGGAKIAGGAGVAAGAGLKAGGEAIGAIKDPGFVLFILGLLTFFFNESLNNTTLAVFIGTIFMFFSALYIFKGKGLAITTIFWVWYVFFGGITDPQTLIYYIGPTILIGMIAHGLFAKMSKRDTFVGGAGGELIGLIPILFFFLDLGLIPILTQIFNLSLTPFIQNLILFMPWWATLGAFTAQPTEGEKVKNFFVTVAKLIMIIWVFSILTFGVVPEAYANYQSIAGPEELLKAKEEVIAKLPKKENPIISDFACAWKMISEPGLNREECIKNRQLSYICERREEVKSGTKTVDECIAKEKEKQITPQIAGTDDLTIKEPTKVEFKVSEYFPKTTYQTTYPYPIQLEIKNPRQQKISINVICKFEKGKEIIEGTVQPETSFDVTKTKETKSFTCTPPEPGLNGTYTLTYYANLYDLQTASRLTRLFVGDVSQKTKEEIEELKRTYVPGKKYLSQAPDEFARINFGFGEPETNPLIEYDDKPLLISTIENVGGGRILAVKNYHIDLETEGIFTDKLGCFSGTNDSEKIKEINSLLPSLKTTFRETTPLTSCFIDIPLELKDTEEFTLREFKATLGYNYQIEKEIKINVKTLGS